MIENGVNQPEKYFEVFPFSIFHFTFVICHCQNRACQVMTNDECNMGNGK
jgi:hypothetical protein